MRETSKWKSNQSHPSDQKFPKDKQVGRVKKQHTHIHTHREWTPNDNDCVRVSTQESFPTKLWLRKWKKRKYDVYPFQINTVREMRILLYYAETYHHPGITYVFQCLFMCVQVVMLLPRRVENVLAKAFSQKDISRFIENWS